MIAELGVTTPIYSTEKIPMLRYFQERAGSVLAQDYDFSWVIVDDGSTDETPDYIRGLKDPRIVFLQRERQPGDKETSSNAVNSGFNYLFENGARFFAYVHSDDFLTPRSLELRVEEIKNHDMVYGRIGKLYNGEVLGTDYPPEGIDYSSAGLLDDGFPHHTSMWSRRMMEMMLKRRPRGPFNPEIESAEDLDVTLYCRRLIKDRFSLGFVNNFLYIWAGSENNITSRVSKEQQNKDLKLIYESNGFPELYKRISKASWKDHFTRFGFWLPDSIRDLLRPGAIFLNNLTSGRLYPNSDPQPEVINLDPYWFKSSR